MDEGKNNFYMGVSSAEGKSKGVSDIEAEIFQL